MERIARSIRLVRQSYRVLMHDKELMVLPLISGAITLAVAASFFFGFGIQHRDVAEDRPFFIAAAFAFYVVAYAIGIFFQAAVVAGASERLRGGDPTVASALAAARRRLGPILVWALVAATAGTILRAIHDRSGWAGRIVTALVGAAWSLATFFIVPVLVLENLGVGESFKRSWAVFKRTWGETVAGSAGVGLVAMLAWLALFAVVTVIMMIPAPLLALAVGIVGAIGVGLFFSALQGVYVASLYRFATDGKEAPGFDRDLLAGAFVPKGGSGTI
jgi:hypothetical protein